MRRHRTPTDQPTRDAGFTLIELLVVIVIVGVLAAIAIPIFLKQREKAIDASVESDLKALATAEETIYTEDDEYVTDDGAHRAALTHVGWRASEDNVVQAYVTTQGFCLRGSNPAGSRGGSAGGYYWYDSLAGGLASTQPDGACTGSPSFTTLS